MTTQPITQQVRWQDLTVRSEIEVVLEIAKKAGWKDCEIFGHGDMITQPQESKSWKLIPADQYKYSIPTQAVARLHQIINAGIRVQGVIIADDQHRTEPAPAPAPARIRVQGVIIADDQHRTEPAPAPVRPAVSHPSVRKGLPFIGKALIGLICIAGVIGVIWLLSMSLIYLVPMVILGLLMSGGSRSGHYYYYDYDPKLVILVDDGKGATVWVSLFTWYD
jgi:hypothetical protein